MIWSPYGFGTRLLLLEDRLCVNTVLSNLTGTVRLVCCEPDDRYCGTFVEPHWEIHVDFETRGYKVYKTSTVSRLPKPLRRYSTLEVASPALLTVFRTSNRGSWLYTTKGISATGLVLEVKLHAGYLNLGSMCFENSDIFCVHCTV